MKKTILAAVSLLMIWACSSDDSSDTDAIQNDDFDRSAMLVNWADNIIIPAYEDLNTKLGTLVSEKDVFIAEPNAANLESLRTAWKEAYKVWQHVEMFNVGMAENTNYIFQMNVYPTNIEDINSNIESQDYNLSSVNNNDAVGFPALDYMLYGLAESDAEIIEVYTSAADSGKRKTYLSDLTDQMKTLTQ